MAKRHTSVSSLLREDFGIEDFVAGDYSKKSGSLAFGLEDVAFANQLGLLSSFKDYDTTSDTFSMEAYNLLGESDQIGVFATQGMEAACNTFAVLAQVKKEYGVEGFDPLAFGAEGFADTVKKAWSWLVAAFKKLIQSVSNFIRGVMNFVGGIVAKTQCGLVDKYKGLQVKDANKGKAIKAMVPRKGLSQILARFNQGIGTAVNILDKGVTAINVKVEKAQSGADYKKLSGEILAAMEGLNAEAKSIDSVKPATAGKELVFGKAVVAELLPAKLLLDGEWKVVLSKDFLGKMKEFVSDGKRLIKMFQTSLKQIDAIQKNIVNIQKEENNAAKEGASKAQKKNLNNANKKVALQMKKTREAIGEISHYRNISGKLTGILYSVYANCLKARSYYASALRSYAAATGKTSAKAKKQAKEDVAFDKRTGARD